MHTSSLLFIDEQKPHEALLELLDLFEVTHNGTIADICRATQEAWYQAGKIRAEIQEKHGHKRDDAMPLFDRLGCISAIRAPDNAEYQSSLVLGALITAVRKRFAFLVTEWERGIRFEGIDLLGSERDLLKDKESPAVLLDANNAEFPFDPEASEGMVLPTNEADMMAMVYRQIASRLPWPQSMPMRLSKAAKVQGRPINTGDNARAWQDQQKPAAGRYLAVSSQPFVAFQAAAMRPELPAGFTLDVIGYEAPKTLEVSKHLDNIAKMIWQIAGNGA